MAISYSIIVFGQTRLTHRGKITGPELPNLAFIDLPGVIQTTESVRASLGCIYR